MATDSTLQKIADNLLAQFDKTLLDNSTDFSSCDQILNAAPSEHKGGLESLYCDLLLDALISGYYRYSEMDTKQLVDDPLYTKFKKMVYGLDRSDPYNLLYYAIIDLVSGKKENVLQYLSAYLDEKIKSLKTESGIFTAEDFTYILVVPLKEGFPGMWSAIGRMLDRDDVEAGIPEDDPRNPAVIADNVGDNVGDVAGMGADLYESYCGSILATAALGAAAFIHTGDTAMQFKAVIAPMLIAAVGILLSIIGIFAVRTKENAKMKDLLASLALGTNLSSVLIVVATFFILWLLKLDNWMWISCAVIVGLVVGIIIGRSTEYYTSQSYRPTQKLSESGKTGPATVIISGIGLGMLSTAIPVIAVVVGIIASYLFASGFDFNNVGMGLYGIGIAAVGMLSTLGITLATDAYGPIADNAGGNAEMSGLGVEVRKRTDALDSLGNTTAATGKGSRFFQMDASCSRMTLSSPVEV